MTILHLTTFLQGGAGAIIAGLASAQQAAGHDVTVVTSATSEPGYGNDAGHPATLRRAGVTLHVVDSLFKRQTALNLRVVSYLQDACGRADRFDVLHAHAAVPALIAMIYAGRSRGSAPVLLTMHGWGIAKSPQQQQDDVAILDLADRVVVPARTSQALLASLGVAPARIGLIPNGTAERTARQDGPHPVEAEMREWRRAGGLVLCCSGTVGHRKNQRLLVEALSAIEPARRPLCVFLGDGETAELQALADRRGATPHVRICGYLGDARHVAAGADFLVLPSLSEGQPIAILEAFCDGVPVIGSAIPEIAELIEDGVTGLLVDATSAAGLTRTIQAAAALAPDARARMAGCARSLYEAQFSMARMHERYLAAYDSVRGSLTPRPR